LGKQPRDLNLLTLLQVEHLRNIPFENLTIYYKGKQSEIALSLKIEELYKKMITKQQGGYCYELNGLFGWFLKEIGFDVSYLGAKVVFDTKFAPKSGNIDHTTLKVNIEGKNYLVDVGFGNSFQNPLPFGEESIEELPVICKYRLIRASKPFIDTINGMFYNYAYQEYEEEQWTTMYLVSEKELNIDDFAESCNWTETSNNSSFIRRLIVTKATREGRISLTQDKITFTTNGVVKNESITEDQIPEILEEYFGLIHQVVNKN
jgi:N-hydroxyarylamine O-acetyltransferase